MATYTLIQSVTVGSTAIALIDFGSIPQTYKDIVVVVNARSARASANNDDILIYPNGLSTNGYNQYLVNSGSSVTSGTISVVLGGYLTAASASTSMFGSSSIYITNYAGSDTKVFSVDGTSENNATAIGQAFEASQYASSDPITSLLVRTYTGNNFVQYSSFALYGISNS